MLYFELLAIYLSLLNQKPWSSCDRNKAFRTCLMTSGGLTFKTPLTDTHLPGLLTILIILQDTRRTAWNDVFGLKCWENVPKQLRTAVICSLAGAVCSNPPLTFCSVCSLIYGCRLDQQQIKADTVSSGSALAGSTPAPTDCWSMAVSRASRSHSSGTCCWRTHVELRMSNSDFNGNKWSRYVVIQIFGEGIITCHRCHCCFVSPFVLGLV